MSLYKLGTGVIKELTELYAKATLVSSYHSEGKGDIQHFRQILSQAKIRQFDQLDLMSKAFVQSYLNSFSGRATHIKSYL